MTGCFVICDCTLSLTEFCSLVASKAAWSKVPHSDRQSIFYTAETPAIKLEIIGLNAFTPPAESEDLDWLEFAEKVPQSKLRRQESTRLSVNSHSYKVISRVLLILADFPIEAWVLLPGRVYVGGSTLREEILNGAWLTHPPEDAGENDES